MKKFFAYALMVVLLLSSCYSPENDHAKNKDSIPATDHIETTVPGIEKLDYSDTIRLKAGEDMRFDKELFRIKAGKKISLIFYNTSQKSAGAMTHNVVVLVKGTDIADFADAARTAKDEQYTPASVAPLIIAHTKMVFAGTTDSVEFVIPQPGVYDYICSFPGHWGTMQGKIVAE